MELSQVLTDARGEAAVLRKHGQEHAARAIETLVEQITEAAQPLLKWVSEADAALRSGHQPRWFAARFAAWQRQGLARFNPKRPRERQYLLVVVPLKHDLDAIRADAERAAKGEESAA